LNTGLSPSAAFAALALPVMATSRLVAPLSWADIALLMFVTDLSISTASRAGFGFLMVLFLPERTLRGAGA
jgi:hypothetical protein